MKRLFSSPLSILIALAIAASAALGAGVVLNPSKSDVNLNGHNINANGGAITNLSGSATGGHQPPWVLGETGSLVAPPTFANSNLVIANGNGLVGLGDFASPAVSLSQIPIGLTLTTVNGSGAPINPSVRWTGPNTFVLLWESRYQSTLKLSGADVTAAYILCSRGRKKSDGSFTLSDPVAAVTESDWSAGAGHHAIAEFSTAVDQSGVIWIVYSRFLSGANGAGMTGQTAVRGVGHWWVKSTDGGKTWTSPVDITASILNVITTNIAANVSTISSWTNDGTNFQMVLSGAQANWGTGWGVKLTGVTDGGGSALNNNVYRVVKVDTTHFTLTNLDGTNVGKTGTPTGGTATPVPMYGYVQAGHGNCRQDGSLDFYVGYRYPADTSGTSYPALVNTSNGFSSVNVYYASDETDTVLTTNPSTEGVPVETSPGNITIYARSLGAGAAAGHVVHHLVAGDTALKNHVFLGNEASCEGSVDKLGDGTLVFTHTDTGAAANRYRLTAFRGTPNGQVIGNQRRVLQYHTSWYSDVAVNPSDGEQILVAYSSGSTGQNSGPYVNHIELRLLTMASLINSAGTLDEFDYDFDEAGSSGNGLPVPVVSGNEGACIYDRGNLGQHMVPHGSPTYVVDSNGYGITFHTATPDYAEIAGANDPALSFDALASDTGALHIELPYKTTASNGTLLGTRAGVGQSGVAIINSGGTPAIVVSDGTTAITAQWSAATNDGNKHVIVAERDPITAASRQVRIKVDAGAWVTQQDTTLTAAGSISNALSKRLNQNDNGTSFPNQDVTYYAPLRIVRGIPASTFSSTYTPAAKPYRQPPTGPPSNTPRAQFTSSQLKFLAYDSTGYGNFSAFLEYPGKQPPTQGQSFGGIISSDAKRYFAYGGETPAIGVWRYDPFLGWCVRRSAVVNYAHTFDSRTTSDFDFIQTTSAWTLGFKAIFHSSAVAMRIFDTSAFGANNGLLLYYNTNRRFTAFINAGGGNKINEDMTASGQLTTGSPYLCVFSGGGSSGQKITFYVIPLSPLNASAPTISTYKYQSSATVATAAGTSGQALQLLYNTDMSICDLWLVNDIEANLRTQIANLATAP